MSKEPREEVWRITARYVAECRLGKQPSVGELIARYPQYADEIADFVAYYHTIEEDADEESERQALPRVAESSPEYAAAFRHLPGDELSVRDEQHALEPEAAAENRNDREDGA